MDNKSSLKTITNDLTLKRAGTLRGGASEQTPSYPGVGQFDVSELPEFMDTVRLEVSKKLGTTCKAALGQFMTPIGIADFMAGLFDDRRADIQLLDPGAGFGSLTAAFVRRFYGKSIDAEAWEVDPMLQGFLKGVLARYESQEHHFRSIIHPTDFIEEAVAKLLTARGTRFTHAILNPPYKKINSNSRHRLLLRKVGVETVNLYTAFLALVILLMKRNGQIVAIVPRSFCNGVYYRGFRELLLRSCAIKKIHLFESRQKAFKEDDVLQENIILHLVKGGRQGNVLVSTSHDGRFLDLQRNVIAFDRIVKPGDSDMFVHIPTVDGPLGDFSKFESTLSSLGVEVSTGPVVDFRVKQYWSASPGKGVVPLLYPHHFSQGKLVYPKEHKKPNGIVVCEETKKWLMPKGYYVIVKRFSSKEERRRVVAYVVNPRELPYDCYGFENHWNVFHMQKHGLSEQVAYGLALYLNSTLVDEGFRVFSGHTQVNAADLRSMRYPALGVLEELGRLSRGKELLQSEVDDLVSGVGRPTGETNRHESAVLRKELGSK